MVKVHATCVEIDGTAVLLMGPPGSGKSDLALRLIDSGARLVSDDYTELSEKEGRLVASAPQAIAGMMEVRGIGVVGVECAGESPVGLAVELVHAGGVERLPDPKTSEYLGVAIPLFRFTAFEESTPAKVRLAAGLANGSVKRIE